MWNELTDLCHSTSKECGWWDNADKYSEAVYEFDSLIIPTKLALIHTEITEAYEYWNNGENDDHLPCYPGVVVEIADTAIRICDLLGYLQTDVNAVCDIVRKNFTFSADGIYILFSNRTMFWSCAGETIIMQLHNFIAKAMEAFRRGKWGEMHKSLAEALVTCELLAEIYEWPLAEVIREKVAYNATRADHKREARAAEGGKKV